MNGLYKASCVFAMVCISPIEQDVNVLINEQMTSSFHLNTGSNDISFEINNLSDTNELQLCFLQNQGTVSIDKLIFDGIDLDYITNQPTTFRYVKCYPIRENTVNQENLVYIGHQLVDAGYFQIIFKTPIDQWIFSQAQYIHAINQRSIP